MRISSPRDLAAAVRGRRLDLSLTQAELAGRAGVSRPWLSQVEAGKASVEFGMILKLLDALDLTLEVSTGGVPATGIDLDELLDDYGSR